MRNRLIHKFLIVVTIMEKERQSETDKTMKINTKMYIQGTRE